MKHLAKDQQDTKTAGLVLHNERKWHSVHSVAQRYEVSVPTVWRWVREGVVPAPVRITTGCSRWDIDALIAHEKKGGL